MLRKDTKVAVLSEEVSHETERNKSGKLPKSTG